MSMDLPFDTYPTYAYGIALVLGFAVCSFLILLFIPAPYGRYARDGWGPTVKAKWAWVIMEAPSPIGFAIVYVMGRHASAPVPLILAAMFLVHYIYRAFIFPFRMRGGDKQKPILTAGLAIVFNCLNGALNAFAISEVATHLNTAWLSDPRFIVGVVIFIFGYAVNHQSDAILMSLRKPGETGYKIPHGGLYRWVSSPNYLGELIEWTGFAMAAWTLPAWVFVLFTAANLVPRAIANHRWYREQFKDYPQERKALLPYLL